MIEQRSTEVFTCDLCGLETEFNQMCRDESVLSVGWAICTACFPTWQAKLAEKVRAVEVQVEHDAPIVPVPSRKALAQAKNSMVQVLANFPLRWQHCVDAFLVHLAATPSKPGQGVMSVHSWLPKLFSRPLQHPAHFTYAYFEHRVRDLHVDHSTRQRWQMCLKAFYEFAGTYKETAKPGGYPFLRGLNESQAKKVPNKLISVDISKLFNEDWTRCIHDWLQSIESHSGSEKTLRMFQSVLTNFFRGHPKPPDKITQQDVLDELHRPSIGNCHRGLEARPGTRNLRRTVIASLYRFAAGYTVPGPDGQPQALFRGLSPVLGIRPGVPDRSYKTLTKEEVERLFSVIPTDTVKGLRDRSLLLFFLFSARRLSEVERLRWMDISETTVADVHGKRRKAMQYRFFGKGYSGQEDFAELAEPAWQALQDYLRASGREESIQPEDPLWLSMTRFPTDPMRPLSAYAISRMMKHYALLADIDPTKISPHVWRHTSTQQRYLLGEDVLSIQRLLRHKSLEATQRYLEGLSSSSDEGIALLERQFTFLATK